MVKPFAENIFVKLEKRENKMPVHDEWIAIPPFEASPGEIIKLFECPHCHIKHDQDNKYHEKMICIDHITIFYNMRNNNLYPYLCVENTFF